MGSFNYGRSVATADKLIRRFGRAATLKRLTVALGHNPAPPTETPATCFVVEDDFSAFERNGATILVTDTRYLIAAKGLTIEPRAGDKLVVGADTFSIVSVKAVSPGGITIVYSAHCRR